MIDLLLSQLEKHPDNWLKYKIRKIKLEILLYQQKEEEVKEHLYQMIASFGISQFDRNKVEPFYYVYTQLGSTYLKLHQPTKALKCFKFILSNTRDSLDQLRTGRLFLSISMAYFQLNNSAKSTKYALKSEDVLRRHLPYESINFLPLGLHMEKLSKLNKSISVQMKSREIIMSIQKYTSCSYISTVSCGLDLCRARQIICFSLTELEGVYEIIRKNIIRISKHGDLIYSNVSLEFLFVMADLCQKAHKNSLALEYIEKAEEILQEHQRASHSWRVLMLRCLCKKILLCKGLGRWKELIRLKKSISVEKERLTWEMGNIESVKICRLLERARK